jgi:NADH:ubiquinone oxidoreductase subunit 6 (subunit J)
VSPYLIVGGEGVWGTIGVAFLFMPICQWLPGGEGDGLHEDTLDTLVMLGQSKILLPLTLVYVIAVLIVDVFSMLLTDMANAVMRLIVQSGRKLFVWIFEIVFYYTCNRPKGIGVGWSRGSWLELAGFVVRLFTALPSIISFQRRANPKTKPKANKNLDRIFFRLVTILFIQVDCSSFKVLHRMAKEIQMPDVTVEPADDSKSCARLIALGLGVWDRREEEVTRMNGMAK